LFLIPSGSVLVVVRSGILRHTVPVAVTSVPCTLNQDMKALVCCPSVFPEYVRLIIQGFQTFILENLTKTGTTVESMKVQEFFSQPFLLPPLAEQHRIVARVDELMALLDRLEAAKEARDATRAQLRDSALAALQDANDAEEVKTAWSRIADHMHDLFTDPADIPSLRHSIFHLAVRGWLVQRDAAVARTVEVREVVRFLNGYAFKSTWYTDPGVRVVRNQNVSHNTIDWQDTKRVSEDRAREFDRFRLEEGDIVLSLDRPIISSGLKVATVRAEDLPCLLLQRVACPRPRDASLSRRYFLVWLKSPDFIESIDPGRSNGVPHISTRAVEAMTLRLPSVDEQNRIASKVDELMAIVGRLEASLLNASRLGETLSVASTRTSTVLGGTANHDRIERDKVGLAESISP
jgi:type I restriction enzyme, S subunit